MCVQEPDLNRPEGKDEERRKRGGGPNTPAGKEISSRNAITHGLRTKKSLILEDESQEEYDAMAAAWREEFEPEGASGERLIQGVILNDWLLRRAESRYLETEMALSEVPPLQWTAEQHHTMELMTRYKTTAERAFYRAFNAMRGLRKDKFREEISLENVRKLMKQELSSVENEVEQERREAELPKAEVKSEVEAKAQVKPAQTETAAMRNAKPKQMKLFARENREKTWQPAWKSEKLRVAG